MSERESLGEKWKSLNPQVKISLVLGTILVLAILALILTPSSKKPRLKSGEKSVRANMVLPNFRDSTTEQLAGSIKAQERTIARLQRDFKKQDKNLKDYFQKIDDLTRLLDNGNDTDKVSVEVIEELKKMQKRIDVIDAKVDLRTGPDTPESYEHNSDLYEYVDEDDDIEEEQAAKTKIVVIGNQDEETQDSNKSDLKPTPYIVANSMVEGVLLNGMDAPTDQSSRSNPVPAVIRLKTEAILPNLVNVHDIQECFLSVAGYGDMADERAKMRTETLSCVLQSDDLAEPARVVEAKVEGFVTSNVDGKVGIRGRLVSKQGQIIAKTLLAGTIGGFADALKPTRIQSLDLNPTGTSRTQRPDAGTIAGSGLAQGVSDAAKSVSEYYLKLADQMMPVLEIDAMTPVTVTFLKGVELK